MNKHLIVSPHFDDAALSASLPLVAAGDSAAVLTVHGGAPDHQNVPASDWDHRCGFTTAAEAVAVRQAEDRASCAITGATPVHLPFADGPYGLVDEQALLEGIRHQLVGGITLWIPAGIGCHPDHELTRRATLPLIHELPAGSVRVYADSPYAGAAGWLTPDHERNPDARWRPHLDAIKRSGVVLDQPEVRRLSTEQLRVKLAMVRCHASQLPELARPFPGLFMRSGPLAVEVNWLAEPA